MLQPVKYCAAVSSNQFLLTCLLLQGTNILSNCKNNIVVKATSGNIILDYQMMTHNGWVDGVKIFQEIGPEMAQLAK